MAALIDPVYSKTLLVISVVSIYLHSCEWCSHCEEENTFDKTRCYNGVILQIAFALGNIVRKLSNIVIIMYDVTCKLKDPRFNT